MTKLTKQQEDYVLERQLEKIREAKEIEDEIDSDEDLLENDN